MKKLFKLISKLFLLLLIFLTGGMWIVVTLLSNDNLREKVNKTAEEIAEKSKKEEDDLDFLK